MSGYSDEQVLMLRKEAEALGEEVDTARALFAKVKQIAQDHATCECSCGVMILAALEGE